MDDIHTDIERIVMRRVHLIRILQLVISTVVLAALTFVAALWGIGREVWVAHVFENMPPLGNLNALMNFWLGAFLHTRLIVQALAVLTLASLVYLAVEIARFIVDVVKSSRPLG